MREVDGQVEHPGQAPGCYDAVVEMLPVGVFRATLDGRLTFANAACLRILGVDPGECLEQVDLGELLRDEEGASAHVSAGDGHIEAPGMGGTRLRGRVVVHRSDGARPVVKVTERLTPDGCGGAWLDGLVEEREDAGLSDRLDVAQRFETIGRVSGTIAHDVNNLMTAIGGYASLLRAGLESDDERLRDVDGILGATDRCRDLVGQLLDAGRRGAGAARVVDAAAVVEGVCGLLERLVGDSGQLVVRVHDRPLPVRIQPVELEQVLINLVTNARDALREGGTIQLTLAEGGDPGGDPGGDTGAGMGSGTGRGSGTGAGRVASQPRRRVVLSVSDDGEGMAEEVAEQVFEPFYTTKDARRGTGLGLSTVRSILERLGGDARLVTRLGAGTRVDVWLPLAEGT